MSGFTKLVSSIITSSIWVEDDSTLRVWIAMLACADANGVVEGSIPGFASLCRMTVEQMETAIGKLSAPDQYSRSKDFEGRRIETIDGGWLILNYGKYRQTRDPEIRRQQVREAVAKHRRNQDVITVSQGKPPKAQAEAEAEEEAKKRERRFAPPSLQEVTEYCRERKNNVDPQAFVSFYESKDWMIGKNKMKNWKSAVHTWERRYPESADTIGTIL